MIPYGRQDITSEDIDAVVGVLQSDFLTQGPQVPHFENKLIAYTGVKHAIAVNSATSALHISCLALGLGPGDYLWTTPITFAASANCALYCGAIVDFVDIDPDTGNLCVLALEKKLLLAEKSGTLPKIVMPVHLAGRPCEMRTIHALGKRFGFSVIEDASHAVGAQYMNTSIGDCRYSDITIFSFHPVKIITTAEGGAALTNSGKLAERLRLLRSHGITRDPKQMEETPQGDWYYEQITLGFNYRMNDIQAALGSSQLERLDSYINRRRDIAKNYDILLKDLPISLFKYSDNSSYHLYTIRIDDKFSQTNRNEVFKRMRQHGVGVNVHYIPVHFHPYYRKLGFKSGDFPAAEKYYLEAMTLPIYPKLEDHELQFIANRLASALS